jgi:hypothetical protein
MRLVFSSFLVGAITSSYGVITFTDTIRQRKHFLEPQFDEEEFKAFLYQAVRNNFSPLVFFPFKRACIFQELNQKLQEKKFGEEGYLQKETQKFVHDKVVPAVRENVNKVFSIPVQEMVNDIIKKFTENK